MFGQSFPIATLFRIPVKAHWSLAIFILFLLGFTFRQSESWSDTLFFGGCILALFGSVLLHEFGHALTARRFGIRTQDIILSPIGGLARLDFIPEIPRQEFIIAIAGPLVNVIIVCLILPFFFLFQLPFHFDLNTIIQSNSIVGLIQLIFYMNVILFVFNLFPIFPMDGGRIFRAFMSYLYGHFTGTRIATFVGKILAIGLLAFAIISNQIVLSVIAVFVFISSNREITSIYLKKTMEESTALDIFRSTYEKIFISDSISKPLNLFKNQKERSFLVFNESGICGVIHEAFLMDAAKKGTSFSGLTDIISQKYTLIPSNTTLDKLYKIMNDKGYSIVPVVNESNEIIGVIDRYDFGDFVKKSTKFRWL